MTPLARRTLTRTLSLAAGAAFLTAAAMLPWPAAHAAAPLGLAPAAEAVQPPPAASIPAAPSIDTTAKQAFMVDMSTNTVLLDKNGDEHMPTSSMAKMMTMYLVFQALQQGRLHLDDALPVSKHAWSMGGSRMFLNEGSRVKVSDLIQGVFVDSGNDAAVCLAEGLAGTEPAFVEQMNAQARRWGLKDTHFMDATGWPDPNHYSSAHDLAIIAEHLIRDYPQYYGYAKDTDFTYNGIHQMNRNPLLYRMPGIVDGVKTGHTESGGYGLTVSAVRNGRRLLLVVNGLDSMQARADEPAKLLEWGFHAFADFKLFTAGAPVDAVPVWLGKADTVPLTVKTPVVVTLTPEQREGLKVTEVVSEPIPAPVAAGVAVGRLVISAPGLEPREVPLYTAAAVEREGALGRMVAWARRAITGDND